LFLPGSGTSSALETLEISFNQDLNGDGVIGPPAPTVPAPTVPTAQVGPVTVANNDTFVFRSDLGAGSVANAARAVELSEHFTSAGNEFSAPFHNAQATPSEPFQGANDGHDTVMNPGHQNSITPIDVHVGNLHASGFFFH
jgi:hypothetical protein